MKSRFFAFIFSSVILFSCGKQKTNNPYLDEVSFRVEINLDLPQYETLNYSGTALYIPRGGIKGIIVVNTGSNFLAFEASDPNHYPNDCSRMQVSGLNAVCSCENNTYSLSNGQPVTSGLSYGMKPYRVSKNGANLIVYN